MLYCPDCRIPGGRGAGGPPQPGWMRAADGVWLSPKWVASGADRLGCSGADRLAEVDRDLAAIGPHTPHCMWLSCGEGKS
eukprot:gene56221-28717_t